MAGRRYLALDGLRGVAAITVVLFHCNNLFHQGPIFQHGYLAVDMFFILSGFVIALTYEDRLKSGFGFAAFLSARARRLLPTFWIGAVLGAVCLIVSLSYRNGEPDWNAFLISIPLTFLLIPQFATPDNQLYPASPFAWSLTTEWVTNALYAAGAYRWSTRTLAAVTVVGWAIMTWVAYGSGRGWCIGFYQTDFVQFGLLRTIPSFTAGVLIYRFHRASWFSRLPVISTELLLTVWLLFAVIPTYTETPLIDTLTVTLVWPALVMLLIRSDFTAPRFCGLLGELSYPLYASSGGLIRLAIETPLFGLSQHPDFPRAIMLVLVCIVVAMSIAGLVRARCRSWGFAS